MPLLLAALAFTGGVHLQGDPVRLKPDTGAAKSAGETVNQYCVPCHSDRLKTAGLSLEGVDVTTPSARAEIWEKVIRKLRTGAMPPPNAVQRPDASTASGLARYLETSIDRQALASPHPGKLALVHRLSRTEYQNA